MKKLKQEKIYIDGWAVVYKYSRIIHTDTTGMGIFSIKKWADNLAKIIGKQYVDVIPVSISFKI